MSVNWTGPSKLLMAGREEGNILPHNPYIPYSLMPCKPPVRLCRLCIMFCGRDRASTYFEAASTNMGTAELNLFKGFLPLFSVHLREYIGRYITTNKPIDRYSLLLYTYVYISICIYIYMHICRVWGIVMFRIMFVEQGYQSRLGMRVCWDPLNTSYLPKNDG